MSSGGYFEQQICELKSRNKASLRFVKGVDRYAVLTSLRQEQMSAAAFRQFPLATEINVFYVTSTDFKEMEPFRV